MKMSVITITWSESVENHAKMQIIGNRHQNGYSIEQLRKCMSIFEEKKEGCCEWIRLNDLLENETEEACLLVVRNGVNIMLEEKSSKSLYDELIVLDVDKKAYMRGSVVNKRARHNLCFADFSQEPEYENKKGRVVSFQQLSIMSKVRELIPSYIEESHDLFAEENLYYDLSKKEVGIGFHGDGERRKVIGMRLGDSMDLQYQWFYQSKPVGKRFRIMLNDGDLYIMSQKTVGTDWLKKNSYTLRHAAHNLAKIKD
jgi:hypothetical protein